MNRCKPNLMYKKISASIYIWLNSNMSSLAFHMLQTVCGKIQRSESQIVQAAPNVTSINWKQEFPSTQQVKRVSAVGLWTVLIKTKVL